MPTPQGSPPQEATEPAAPPWSWGSHPGWPRLGLLWLQFSFKSEQDPNT